VFLISDRLRKFWEVIGFILRAIEKWNQQNPEGQFDCYIIDNDNIDSDNIDNDNIDIEDNIYDVI
jgi:hypothetical protein